MAEAIEARGLTVRRGRRAVLEGVHLSAPAGSISAILGPNGAGKSTLLKALAGLLPSAGEVRLYGVPLRELSPLERALSVAYVPQQSELRAAFRVRDVVALGRYAHRESSERRALSAERALARAGIGALAERPFTELSGGEQRRVLIARALATGAQILLLDEPTAALDIQHALGLFALCRELAATGHTVVMVLHQLGDALRFADRALILDDGRVVAAGAAGETIVPERVRQVYGVQMHARGAPAFEALLDCGE